MYFNLFWSVAFYVEEMGANFYIFFCIEQKKQKLAELKIGLDEGESLVGYSSFFLNFSMFTSILIFRLIFFFVVED